MYFNLLHLIDNERYENLPSFGEYNNPNNELQNEPWNSYDWVNHQPKWKYPHPAMRDSIRPLKNKLYR